MLCILNTAFPRASTYAPRSMDSWLNEPLLSRVIAFRMKNESVFAIDNEAAAWHISLVCGESPAAARQPVACAEAILIANH
ncbi:MAG: hypothetical protein [Circular genetic element sp.]|nr:MAG: hypothetical protein [Circular genetic element sp.]